MSLLQRAIETYDFMDQNQSVGIYEENKEPLAPVAHKIVNSNITISIDITGSFLTANKCNEKIIIPVSQDSANRSNNNSPHALCDTIKYVAEIDDKKHELYVKQLNDWGNSRFSHPKVEAVLRYIKKGSVLKDLDKCGLIRYKTDDSIGNCDDMIRWIIHGLSEIENGAVWNDKSLFQKYTEYYINEKLKNSATNLCYVSGNHEIVARLHLKGLVPRFPKAVLVSANDSENFTFRGRFKNKEEALCIGYISSQKAHNALKWIVANQGVPIGKKTFVCWTPRGIEIPRIDLPLSFNEKKVFRMSEYRIKLKSFLSGYSELNKYDARAVISILDATNKDAGRLSLVYYNELVGDEYINRLMDWYETCCWITVTGNISSPSLNKITILSYGTQRGNDDNAKMEIDSQIEGQVFQRLFVCRLDKTRFPQDIITGLFNKSNNMQAYNENNRRDILFTTCAVIRKHWKDHHNKEVSMALDENFKDRSYQFGRLLAVLEKIERDTYDANEKREPNAIRLQSVFVKRPVYAFKLIMEQLKNAYYPKINQGYRVMYEKLIGQIMEEISTYPASEYGKPLSELYLIGYYLQKNHLYEKHAKDEEVRETE